MDANTAADLGLVTHRHVAGVDACIKTLASEASCPNTLPACEPASPVAKLHPRFSPTKTAVLMNGDCPDGFDKEEKLVARQIKSLSFTAPIGLRMVSDLIDATATTDLQAD